MPVRMSDALREELTRKAREYYERHPEELPAGAMPRHVTLSPADTPSAAPLDPDEPPEAPSGWNNSEAAAWQSGWTIGAAAAAAAALCATENLIDPVVLLRDVGGWGVAHEDGWVLMPREMAEALRDATQPAVALSYEQRLSLIQADQRVKEIGKDGPSDYDRDLLARMLDIIGPVR
jgi:hypothetical protein